MRSGLWPAWGRKEGKETGWLEEGRTDGFENGDDKENAEGLKGIIRRAAMCW